MEEIFCGRNVCRIYFWPLFAKISSAKYL